jgi:ribosomal protein S7
MKNADYTQKTTEVAQQRKQLEQEAQQAQIMYEVVEQEIEAKSRLTNINQELQDMQNIDWDAYFDQDPISAQKTNMRMQQLANEQVNLKTHLQNAYNQRTEIAKQATANRITATKDYAAKNIPGWSPSSYDNIVSEAINEHGFTQEQIDNAMSPSVLKILHLAQLGSLSQKKQAKIPTLSQKAKATKPLKKVSSRSSGVITKDPYKMSMEEYDKWSEKTFK